MLLEQISSFAIYPTSKRAVLPRHLVMYERDVAPPLLQDNAAILPPPRVGHARRREKREGSKNHVHGGCVIFRQMPI